MSEANAKSGMPVRKWIAEYDKYGEEAFTNKIRNKQYSKDFKETVIKEYLGECKIKDALPLGKASNNFYLFCLST